MVQVACKLRLLHNNYILKHSKLDDRNYPGACEKKINQNTMQTLLTTSSILRILRTVSVARVNALKDTSSGWTTSSSKMLEMPPCENKQLLLCASWTTVS